MRGTDELHIYDFDGTLFGSPMPPKNWTQGTGNWFSNLRSLLKPCVPTRPGSEWWNSEILSSAKQSINNQNIYAVLMTGRSNSGGMRYRIAELLKSANLDFDAVYLKYGKGSTEEFKAGMIGKILDKFQNIGIVHVWDDRVNHFESFKKAAEQREATIITHPVSHFSLEPGCDANDLMEVFEKADFKDVYKTARSAHAGQLRRGGEPYFTHPKSVRNIVRRYYPTDKVAQLAALLHDTIEDAPKIGTVKSIEEMQDKILLAIQNKKMANDVLKTVQQVTHERGDYTSYVLGLVGSPQALRVKLSDMEHNLQTAGDRQRNKYYNALMALSNITDGAAPNSIHPRHWDKLMKMSTPDDLKEVRKLIRKILTESKGETEQVFMNELDPTMPVIILYPSSEKYSFFAEHFKNTHAFNWLEKNMMFVDGAAVEEGWFTDDHLLVMQAHELGHKLAGHIDKQQANHRDPVLEREADWVGYNILKNRGYDSAAKLHLDEFEVRYGVKPDAVANDMIHLMNAVQ